MAEWHTRRAQNAVGQQSLCRFNPCFRHSEVFDKIAAMVQQADAPARETGVLPDLLVQIQFAALCDSPIVTGIRI